MKLIDILKQELPKRGGWPEGVARLAQDPDGDLQFCSNKPIWLCSVGWTGEGRNDFRGQYIRDISVIAEDYEVAIITREQYETESV